MNSPNPHSFDKVEEILREGGADTEVVARAMVEGFRALDASNKETIAALPKPAAQTSTIIGSAGAVLVGLGLATMFVVSEIRSTSKSQAETLAASHAALLEKQAGLIRDTERSGVAAAKAANDAGEAAARAGRSADEIERNTREISRLVTILQERERATAERTKN